MGHRDGKTQRSFSTPFLPKEDIGMEKTFSFAECRFQFTPERHYYITNVSWQAPAS